MEHQLELQEWFNELILNQCNGPGEFLKTVMNSEEESNNVSAMLVQEIPASACSYFDKSSQQADKSLVKLHCADLVDLYEWRTRACPCPEACKRIFDDIRTSEFKTSDNPLEITVEAEEGGELKLRCLKGMTRTCALLTLLLGMQELGVALPMTPRKLMMSCAEIHATYREWPRIDPKWQQRLKTASRIDLREPEPARRSEDNAIVVSDDDATEVEDVTKPETKPERWLDGTVRDDFMEIFTPPRVAPVLKARGFRAELSLDITTGEQFNFMTSEGRGPCLHPLRSRRPRVVLTCSPCKFFSKMMKMNLRAMDPEQKRILEEEAEVLFAFGMLVVEHQIAQKSGYVHEHPQSASSWRKPKVQEIIDAGSGTVDFDQCAFDHRYPGSKAFIQKKRDS